MTDHEMTEEEKIFHSMCTIDTDCVCMKKKERRVKITNCGCGPEHSRDCPQGLGDY